MGFLVHEVASGSYGLRSMSERAELLSVFSRPGEGATVRVILPLP